MKLPVSIIIPTFNEEKYLPKLLNSIKNQTAQPAEVIISDAFSQDKTRELAKSYGYKVVDGGLPAKGRNNGAKAAKEEILLFLDSDVVLPKKFLEETVSEMVDRKLDIASCYVAPLSNKAADKLMHEAFNYYSHLTQNFHPHVPGFCIFVKRKVHHKIKGFDESVVLCEDQDYVSRAAKVGEFSFLESYKIPVSVRRATKEGRVKFALKYIAMELHLIFLGKIKKDIFNYQFGHK